VNQLLAWCLIVSFLCNTLLIRNALRTMRDRRELAKRVLQLIVTNNVDRAVKLLRAFLGEEDQGFAKSQIVQEAIANEREACAQAASDPAIAAAIRARGEKRL
jgi:hypothetical protein